MKAFINLRGAINSVRSEVRTKLPKCLSDIDIEKKDFESYTVTTEKQPFLRYDNKNNNPKER